MGGLLKLKIVYNLPMRTVGQILKEERERKFYTLEDIEKVTKIRVELLQALERDDYKKLPPPTFVQGFIKNYGKFLKLDVEKLLAIFRREFSDRKNPPRILESFSNPLDKKINFTPKKLISIVVIGLILTFFIYLWFEYRFLVGPPSLSVVSPLDQTVFENSTIEVLGKTEPEAKIILNDQEVTVDSEGNFKQEMRLGEGMTKIVIIATSKFNKSYKIERTVYLK